MPDWNPAGRRLLLDTHVWLWIEEGNARIRRSRFWKELARLREKQAILVSVISVWELAMLAQKRRVTLSMECGAWVEKALNVPGLELQTLTPEIAVLSAQFGEGLHPDPADRFLVATAIALGATLATADARILDFSAKERRLKTLPV